MAYIGKTPTPAPLTSSDIASDIINSTHIGDTAISGFDALATAPADTDEFLISDAGVLKRLDASLVGKGKLLQFVNQEEQSSYQSNSSSAADTGINVSITPTATDSKILLTTNFSMRTAGNTYVAFYIYRQINGGGYSVLDQLDVSNHYYLNETIQTIFYGKKVDTTHNTTNQIDYKIYANVQGGGGNLSILIDTTSQLGNFSAMEIGA